MPITLSEESRPARMIKSGSETVQVAAGKEVQIRYWAPGATTVLDVNVPTGKVWAVTFNVHIVETDA